MNLRPLWSLVAEALSALAMRLGNPIWTLMFGELSHVATEDKTSVCPPWLKEKESIVRDQDTWEEERSWRDGSAHKIRQTVDEWLGDAVERKAIILVSSLKLPSCFYLLMLYQEQKPSDSSILPHTKSSC